MNRMSTLKRINRNKNIYFIKEKENEKLAKHNERVCTNG